MIIDTHIHLDSTRYDEDLEEVLKRAKSEDIRGFIIPGADPKDFKRAKIISESYYNIFLSSGVHPYHAREFILEEVEEFALDKNCVAIGECGLDYYRLPETQEEIDEEKRVQKEVFIAQIELAKKLSLPLIVHVREANQDSYDILKQTEAKEVGGVLHCYNASELLLDLADDNFYFGIGGVLTFKNAKALPKILEKIPLEKILIETDGPYLTPHPYRGKRNEPSYTTFIAEKIAEILQVDRTEVERVTSENALTLFKRLEIA